jgi:hypothetical protein
MSDLAEPAFSFAVVTEKARIRHDLQFNVWVLPEDVILPTEIV